MTRRQSGVGGWFSEQIRNLSLPAVSCILVGGLVFYVTTDTRLKDHDSHFSKLDREFAEYQKNETSDREKIKSEFVTDSKTTANGIAELNKQTAVMSTILSSMKDEIVKLNNRYDQLPNTRR